MLERNLPTRGHQEWITTPKHPLAAALCPDFEPLESGWTGRSGRRRRRRRNPRIFNTDQYSKPHVREKNGWAKRKAAVESGKQSVCHHSRKFPIAEIEMSRISDSYSVGVCGDSRVAVGGQQNEAFAILHIPCSYTFFHRFLKIQLAFQVPQKLEWLNQYSEDWV